MDRNSVHRPEDCSGFGEIQDDFHEFIEILLWQGFDLRPDALHGGSSGDQPVIPRPALTALHVLDAVGPALDLMFKLFDLGFVPSDLCFQRFDIFMTFHL